jgi:hypothetical protein
MEGREGSVERRGIAPRPGVHDALGGAVPGAGVARPLGPCRGPRLAVVRLLDGGDSLGDQLEALLLGDVGDRLPVEAGQPLLVELVPQQAFSGNWLGHRRLVR